LVNDNF